MKQLKRIAKSIWISGAVLLSLAALRQAHAAPADTMTVTVTPSEASLVYAVEITSPEVQGYDFGAVDIAATTISTTPIGVANVGNIAAYFSVGVQDITPTYAWTNNSASLTPGSTSYVMQAQFVAEDAAQPAEAAFAGAANNVPVSAPIVAEGKFGQAGGLPGKTMPGVTKDLWLRLQMPTAVEETGEHTMVLTINGQAN
jgi:hypothetical protein